MISEKDTQDEYYKIYKKEITIKEFENWIYGNQSIEQIIGEETYLQLISLNYNDKDALFQLGKILFKIVDDKEIKKLAIYNIMKDLITEYLDKKYDRDDIVNKLIHSVTISDLDEVDDEFLNDCYYAIYEMNEAGFETTEKEVVYLKECFDGKRIFSRKKRDEYINENIQVPHNYFEKSSLAKKEIIIDGNRFDNIEEFYNEVDRVLTRNLKWKTGHNLDAFNDLLRGGFGIHEYGEPIVITWENANKSKNDLGYKATVKHYENMLKTCHPTNIDYVRGLLKSAKQEKGDTLFDIIVEIIIEHEEIDLILK